ncbi:MAG: helix-turn-helix domain-containing protein [Kiritimatiellia bacterium]|nr:helix-turn-helix domain-containing protein [Kiritimatiellia bacterium]
MAGKETVQSLERGMAILEAVAASEEGLSLSDLAARLGVLPTTVFNLARTLVLRGYLDKGGRPVRYRLGPGAYRLVRNRERRRLVSETERTFREMARLFPDATLVLAEPLGIELAASLRMDTSPPSLLERAPNWVMPPYTTAVSVCFLAFWPLSETAAYRRRHSFSEHGRAFWREETKLDAALADARRAGFVLLTQDRPFRMAVPLRAPSGQYVAAFGLSLHETDGVSARLRKQAVRVWTAAASELSKRMRDDGGTEGTGEG